MRQLIRYQKWRGSFLKKILQDGEYEKWIIVKIQSLAFDNRHYEAIAIDELLSGNEYSISTIFGNMRLFTSKGMKPFSFLLTNVSVKYNIESKKFNVIGLELHSTK